MTGEQKKPEPQVCQPKIPRTCSTCQHVWQPVTEAPCNNCTYWHGVHTLWELRKDPL